MGIMAMIKSEKNSHSNDGQFIPMEIQCALDSYITMTPWMNVVPSHY
jgi:hypothetical protein